MRHAAVGERRRVMQRAPGRDVGRLDVVGRIFAGGSLQPASWVTPASASDPPAHELHELAARRSVELSGAGRELRRDRGLEGGTIVALLGRPPLLGPGAGNRWSGRSFAHRWHVVQLVREWTSFIEVGACAVLAPDSVEWVSKVP